MHGTWNQKQKKTPTHDAFLEKDSNVLFVHKTTTTHKKQQLAFSPMNDDDPASGHLVSCG